MRISDWSSDVCSSDLEIAKKTTAQTTFFGLSEELIKTFPSDDDLHSDSSIHKKAPTPLFPVDVELTTLTKNEATFTIGGKKITTHLKLNGLYNEIGRETCRERV